jgi:hypothetical protein
MHMGSIAAAVVSWHYGGMATESKTGEVGNEGAPGVAAEVASESRPIFAIFEGGGDIFSAHSLSPIEVLGEGDWRLFQRLRR